MYGKLKLKILELRKQGYSYNKIKDVLGCSKGTIAFHCGEGQKEKSNLRKRKKRDVSPVVKKIENFYSNSRKKINEHERMKIITDKTIRLKLRSKLLSFFKKTKRRINNKRKYEGYKSMFTVDQLIEKIGENPICYLTGVPIDLNKSRSYHLDHIVPKSRGGDDSLDNCQIACRIANQAKGDMLLEEFIDLCKKVIDKQCGN